MEPESLTIARIVGAVMLYLFLPLTATTYYFSRLRRRLAEVERTLRLLNIDPDYRKAYEPENFSYYLWAVGYASVVACAGLTLLFFSAEIGIPGGEFPSAQVGSADFPEKGSRLVFIMAFLGAYLWGIQHLFRRYSLNDLTPSVYYGLGIRMILAAVLAVVLYNGLTALSGGESQGGITANIWPALAFLLGMFPQRGVRYLTARVPLLAQDNKQAVIPAPLELIEGVESHDILRLEEHGIDTCHDLANVDFVPLTLKTPYSSRQLIDWILQAKLCVYFGEAVRDLRRHGIRLIVDLEPLTKEDMEVLALESSVTKYSLERAQQSIKGSQEIRRLLEAGHLLGGFWRREGGAEPRTDTRGP